MALVAAVILAGIAIGLLAVYGADVAVGMASESDGFLPFDHMVRGIGLGMPSLVLPFVAYLISRREPSRGLGAMIVTAGALIIIGGAVVIGNADPAEAAESGRDAASESVPLLAAGAVQIGMGILKIVRS